MTERRKKTATRTEIVARTGREIVRRIRIESAGLAEANAIGVVAVIVKIETVAVAGVVIVDVLVARKKVAGDLAVLTAMDVNDPVVQEEAKIVKGLAVDGLLRRLRNPQLR